MIKICNCKKDTPDLSKKNIFIFKAGDFKLLREAMCLFCGMRWTNLYDEDRRKVKGLTTIIPLEDIRKEYFFVQEIFEQKNIQMPENPIYLYEIMKLVIQAYEGDYYNCFNSWKFKDVRVSIVNFVLEHNSNVPSIIKNKYIEWIQKDLSFVKVFNLEEAISFPIKLEDNKAKSNEITNQALFGPVATRKDENKFYLRRSNFKKSREAILFEIKKIENKINHTLFDLLYKEYRGEEHFIKVWKAYNPRFKIDAKEICKYVAGEKKGTNKIFLTGFSEIVKQTLEYLSNIPEITADNNEEILANMLKISEEVLEY